ncbi:hypothetical protein JB92DRAFT_3018898 [Gautieria morchelliformis]|nr:hypothetical protein JB92DRAFT_3018898 [Gautieria morchelliformis]
MSIAPQSFITITEYSALASLVSSSIHLYETAITFDAEVMNIWSGPRTWESYCFYGSTRYFGLSSLIIEVTEYYHSSCSVFFWWEAVSSMLFIIAKKQLLYGLAGLRLITTAVSIVRVALPPVHNLTGCSSPSVSRNLGASFIPSLANELVLCFLMLYKQRDRYRNEFGSSQLKLLVQDSLALVAIGWEFAIPCTMGCRLLLNVLNHYGSGEHTILLQSRQNASYLLSDVHMQSLSSHGC